MRVHDPMNTTTACVLFDCVMKNYFMDTPQNYRTFHFSPTSLSIRSQYEPYIPPTPPLPHHHRTPCILRPSFYVRLTSILLFLRSNTLNLKRAPAAWSSTGMLLLERSRVSSFPILPNPSGHCSNPTPFIRRIFILVSRLQSGFQFEIGF